MKYKKWLALIIAIITVITVFLFSANSYKKTIDHFFKAYEKNDPDILYNDVIADYWINYMNIGWGEGVAYESLEDSIEDNLDDWGLGNNIKITYEIKDKIKASDKEVKELEMYIIDNYVDYVGNEDNYSISAAYLLDVHFVVEAKGNTTKQYYPDGLLVIKENGKWKITRGHLSCSFPDDYTNIFAH
ncbi:MAG: hypothetical protein IJ489_09650 [Clostridia bacterium]|nr:hypothetical protein [Clostridia bacterium]